VLLSANSKSTSEVRALLPLYQDQDQYQDQEQAQYQDPEFRLELLREREPGHQYFVDRVNGVYYILSSMPGMERSLYISKDQGSGGLGEWVRVVQGQVGETMEDVEVFEGFSAIYGRRQGVPCLRVLSHGDIQDIQDNQDNQDNQDIDDGPLKLLELPGGGSDCVHVQAISGGMNQGYQSGMLRLSRCMSPCSYIEPVSQYS